jgi:UDP-apiose/xylose synthase
MRICIFGAGGFIGSNLVDYLVRRDEHQVIGLDVSAEKLEGIEGDNFTFVEADIITAKDLAKQLVAETDVVVDLIAYANPSIYVEKPLEVYQLNFVENMRIVNDCVEHGTRLIQYSTSEVYGKANGEAYSEEDSDLIMGPINRQRWIYASGKQLLERVIHAHGVEGNLEYTIVRPFNFIGPRFDYLVPAGSTGGPRVFAHFMSALLTGGPMYLVDGGNRRRCFTHIEDANEAFTAMLEHPGALNQIFNVGNPATDISVRDLALLMKELYEELTGTPADNELVDIDGSEFYGPGYEDMDRVPPAISKLQALGWSPTRDLRTTFRDAIAYYVEG